MIPADPTVIDIVGDLPVHPTLEYEQRPLTAITTLTIHHAASNSTPEQMATYHVNHNGWPGIGYHEVVMSDGTVYLTNYLTTKSYHAGSYNVPGDENYWSVGICLSGNFTDSPPPQAQQDAARARVIHHRAMLPGVTAVTPHRHMPGAQTQCPGNTWASWFPYVAGEDGAQRAQQEGDEFTGECVSDAVGE